ncbi:murein L,D-transpeptidase catalytic domain family protein [Prosthecochloris sp. N3]|uniref:Murein L,D-transpeptidase catalytic domain family protein n=1 Tax=Prosthecochloris ethylica TaxID=2743976 RepID=A0ABR9XRX9_9CHLB|nr:MULTISPECIES: murein L,D-transpeptidase catalytic domain family protein [Prosthecochloris]MEC9487238.1 murein L,D-transpeptidase catalytic domain family protein [Prosthecochloris sp.]MBF0586035.1 murein L,D-transpeptidase catalytic domain family protein [Prosthecochloris ethylica]MBF0636565.1 murein L,D-transpeptidase catalytic domain family protein [Prosthecochloris ethylica]NUK47197.1 murein L,D-transpeptidase catalytic domain family protein [Prosthecochloris ethylica]RNA65729.1 hypotheti
MSISLRRRAIGLAGVGLLAVLLGYWALLFTRPQVSPQAEQAARQALHDWLARHPGERADVLAVVDYSRPSYARRMVIIDLDTGERRLFRVAHGINSGELYARSFSNEPGSNMSSLGLYRAGDVYEGDHGPAMRLHGLDSLRNSRAFERDIVLHSAWYVSLPVILQNVVTFNGPRTGRSEGCFVVSSAAIDDVLQALGGNAFLYAYGHHDVSE